MKLGEAGAPSPLLRAEWRLSRSYRDDDERRLLADLRRFGTSEPLGLGQHPYLNSSADASAVLYILQTGNGKPTQPYAS